LVSGLVGTVKIYVAAVQALWIKEIHGETQKTIMLKLQNFTLPKERKKERKGKKSYMQIYYS
jgi:hypothetical protein